ncbi:TRAP transporter large permease [Garciella nitratireducens]|uniref:TRAP transporter, DctM subunit n=1 Tax=Garciella nitratireducens DSM 15102 TaxID=1121911 RepID=A0A1T4P3R0_9FIRM|nr:TRAP transporter large permease [Garciella nitratireducens]SJZ86089.1 TRAP transporter, DctM subunit [Garciella nitratireducens DSM 15102]
MAFTALFTILIVLAILLLAGIPIAVALGISSVAAILPTVDLNITVVTAAQRIFSGMSNFTLIAIPFFILAGNIMNQGGIAQKLINFALAIVGRIPGSLLHTNIVGNAMFGAISGSATAAAAAIGGVMNEEEKKHGQDINLGAAANIASAPSGLLIPPSNTLITYSLVSGGTSVAALFIAGYIPGIVWTLGCLAVSFIFAKKKGYTGVTSSFSFKVVGKTFLEALPALLLIVIVIGGIVGGIFTATEGSAIAVVYSLILSMFFYRSIDLKKLWKIFVDSAETTGIIIFLIGVSNIMSWVMAFTGIPNAIADALLGISNNPVIILLIMNIILLIVGTFMDVTPAILIFTPIFLPIAQSFGIHPIHFGIIIVYNLCIGNITPPVGNTLFVGVRVAGTTIEKVIPSLVRFYVAILVGLILVTYIPSLSMFLPDLLGLVG